LPGGKIRARARQVTPREDDEPDAPPHAPRGERRARALDPLPRARERLTEAPTLLHVVGGGLLAGALLAALGSIDTPPADWPPFAPTGFVLGAAAGASTLFVERSAQRFPVSRRRAVAAGLAAALATALVFAIGFVQLGYAMGVVAERSFENGLTMVR